MHRHFPNTVPLAALSAARRYSPQAVRARVEELWTWIEDDGDCDSALVGFGCGGWLYTALVAQRCFAHDGARWQERVSRLRARVDELPSPRTGTFLEGDSGPRALLCALGADAGPLAAAAMKANASPSLPCELLYGRVGIMHSLFVSGAVAQPDVHRALLALFDETVRQGLAEGAARGAPLHWTWHGKPYLGLVHGVAGILCMLLRAYRAMTDDEQHSRRAAFDAIMSSAEWLTQQTLPSGNLPTHSGSDRDELVQICHGAPALALFACVFFRDTNAPIFRLCAERAAAVVYERGLLRKGVGLCHGIGGNALVLLEVHRITRDPKWLHACWHFVEFALDRTATPDARLLLEPDDPLSFLNGLAGFVTALALVLDSETNNDFTFPLL